VSSGAEAHLVSLMGLASGSDRRKVSLAATLFLGGCVVAVVGSADEQTALDSRDRYRRGLFRAP
jgi:hypothetical protein